jgi:hypothetical protein
MIIIIVTVTKKSYSVYINIKYYSKQGEKIMVLVRILMSKSGFKDDRLYEFNILSFLNVLYDISFKSLFSYIFYT